MNHRNVHGIPAESTVSDLRRIRKTDPNPFVREGSARGPCRRELKIHPEIHAEIVSSPTNLLLSIRLPHTKFEIEKGVQL